MSRSRTPLLALLAAVSSAALAGGCGSTAGPARLSVRLVDGPGDFRAVHLHVARVELNGPEGWITLASPDATVDLLELTGGVSATLVDGATIPAGRYGQFRLVLGGGNTVTLADGTVHDLTVPSGLQSGVKLTTSFEVAAGTTRDVFIDFDAHRSIFVHGAGQSGKWILRPTVRAVDRLATGSIRGILTDAATAAPLPGARVTAQLLDTTGTPSVVRSSVTAADGSYTLDLLPAGASYHVVSQPEAVDGETVRSYLARASGPIAISTADATPTWSAAFTSTSAVGGLGGAVRPAASDAGADLVSVRQSLDAGGTPATFEIRAVSPSVAAGVERYEVARLPAATYRVLASRRTIDAAGAETMAVTPAVEAAVAAGGVATADLAFP